MKLFILILVTLLATACSHTTPRTKWTDPVMRVIIDPVSIDANNYVRIQQALVASGKWIVLDRAMAFQAIEREQELQHRVQTDRFSDREKWALWSRLLGAGGVVTAHTQCQIKKNFMTSRYLHCQQFIAINNATTGEVIATAENEENGDNNEFNLAPSWEETVDRMNKAYPENYAINKDSEILDNYRDLAKEEAQRAREAQAKENK